MTPRSASNELLKEGTKSYLDALMALEEFRVQVRTRWRSAIEECLADHSKSMGLSLSSRLIKEYREYSPLSPNWTAVGVQIAPKSCGGRLYYALEWQRTVEETYCGLFISAWYGKKAKVDKAWNSISTHKTGDWIVDSDSLYVCRSLNGSETLDQEIREILEEWNQTWMKAGGLADL